jgi:hypothetical protein
LNAQPPRSIPCPEACASEIKKPRPVGLTGVDGEHKAHAIGLRKRRDESSRSAVEASDCFQFLPGLVTRLVSEKSNNCRLNPGRRADKPNFSIAISGVIDVFFIWFHTRGGIENGSGNTSAKNRRKRKITREPGIFWRGGLQTLLNASLEKKTPAIVGIARFSP